MKIIRNQEVTDAFNATMTAEKKVMQSGKLRVAWSQTRGGYAIFVSGRMEGQLFESEYAAIEYLQTKHEITL